MNGDRRLFLQSLGAAMMGVTALSGCLSNSTTETPPESTNDSTTSQSENEAQTTVELPNGVSEDGLTDFTMIQTQTEDTYQTEGVHLQYSQTRTIPSYNSISETVIVNPETGKLFRNQEENTEDGSLHGFNRVYLSLDDEVGYSHNMEAGVTEDPEPLTDLRQMDFDTLYTTVYPELFASKVAFAGQFEYTLNTNNAADGITLEAVGTSDDFSLSEVEIDGSNYSLETGRLTLTTNGALHSYQLDLASDEYEYDVEFDATLGETTVQRPDWVPDETSST